MVRISRCAGSRGADRTSPGGVAGREIAIIEENPERLGYRERAAIEEGEELVANRRSGHEST